MLSIKIIICFIIPLLAQATGERATTGSYNILVDGKPAGMERFDALADKHLIIKSTTESTLDGVAQKTTAITELNGASPVRYEVETSAGGRAQKYSLRFKEGIARVVIEAYGRRSERAIPVNEDVVLLDKNVWHHYSLLIGRYDIKNRKPQRFAVLTPQAGLSQYIAEVELKEKTTFKAEGVKLRANRFIITLGDGYEAIVVADESNRLLSVEVSALETKVVLQF